MEALSAGTMVPGKGQEDKTEPGQESPIGDPGNPPTRSPRRNPYHIAPARMGEETMWSGVDHLGIKGPRYGGHGNLACTCGGGKGGRQKAW